MCSRLLFYPKKLLNLCWSGLVLITMPPLWRPPRMECGPPNLHRDRSRERIPRHDKRSSVASALGGGAGRNPTGERLWDLTTHNCVCGDDLHGEALTCAAAEFRISQSNRSPRKTRRANAHSGGGGGVVVINNNNDALCVPVACITRLTPLRPSVVGWESLDS